MTNIPHCQLAGSIESTKPQFLSHSKGFNQVALAVVQIVQIEQILMGPGSDYKKYCLGQINIDCPVKEILIARLKEIWIFWFKEILIVRFKEIWCRVQSCPLAFKEILIGRKQRGISPSDAESKTQIQFIQ